GIEATSSAKFTPSAACRRSSADRRLIAAGTLNIEVSMRVAVMTTWEIGASSACAMKGRAAEAVRQTREARWSRIWNRVPFIVLDRRGDPRDGLPQVNHDFH